MEPIYLTDNNLTIKPLIEDEINSIAKALVDPDGFFAINWNIKDHLNIVDMLKKQLNAYQNLKNYPFVYYVNDEVAGISRFLNIDATHKCLEIGGTWIAPKWRRTFINTKVKYILLKYCFEKLNTERVEFRVNEKNFQSQMAVLRIGAIFEAKLRNRTIPPLTQPAAMHCYSVIRSEWAKTKERLEQLMQNKSVQTEFLPYHFSSQNLNIEIYKLSDSVELYNLAVKNQSHIRGSFPTCGNFTSPQDAMSFIARKAHDAAAGRDFFYSIKLINTSKQIGHIHLKNLNWQIGSADIGYFIDESYWRKGFAFEAISKAITVLKNKGIHRLTLRTLDDNFASQALALKLEFTKESFSPQSFIDGFGKIRDTITFSKIIQN